EVTLMKIHGWKTACVGLLLGLVLLVSGCGQEAEPMEQEIAVEIALPDQGALTLEGRFIGTVSSGEDVSIIPMVSGEITDVYVEVGDRVEAGQLLAQIDDTNARMQLNSATAGYNSAVAAAQQTTGASWDMQTMSTEASIAQMQDAINNYYQQIDSAEQSMNKLSDQIADLKQQRADLEDQSDQISDGIDQAERAMNAAQTKYYTALAMRSQMETYGVTDEVSLMQLEMIDPTAAATIRQSLLSQGLTMADVSDSGIALLKSAYDDASTAYNNLSGSTATVASGLSGIDTAIAQCESGIDQYQNAIQQYLAAIRTYEQNLDLAKQSAVLTDTQLKDETQAVLNAQINAAGVGVQSAREALEYYRLTSPIDGVVTAVSVQRYGMAAPGYAAFTVSNQDAMTVTFSVSQSVRDSLRVGEQVSVSGAGKTFKGAINEARAHVARFLGFADAKPDRTCGGAMEALRLSQDLARESVMSIYHMDAQTADKYFRDLWLVVFSFATLVVTDDCPYTDAEMSAVLTEVSLSVCKAYKEIPGLPEGHFDRDAIFRELVKK
ncbi:MAG: HlyD family efflux transporter periplasmic adaptor subunit, partial [Firmicutes bacterium]|nr:HlyD family efflux transporter periplasmic adaptor subunit [Bacillota bacterium]